MHIDERDKNVRKRNQKARKVSSLLTGLLNGLAEKMTSNGRKIAIPLKAKLI